MPSSMSQVSFTTLESQDGETTAAHTTLSAASLQLPQLHLEASSSSVAESSHGRSAHVTAARDMSSRFERSSLTPFRPEPVTANFGFSIIPQGDQTFVNNLASHAPPEISHPAINQQYEREQHPRHQTYDVDVCKFLEHWSLDSLHRNDSRGIQRPVIGKDAQFVRSWPRPDHIRAEDVRGDKYDIQGIDWSSLGTTRALAREARAKYCEAIQLQSRSSDRPHVRSATPSVDLFKFKRMNARHRAWIEHFQLRNAISVNSHNDILYASRSKVHRTDPLGGTKGTVMDLTAIDMTESGAGHFAITALDSLDGLAAVGSFTGEYAIANLDAKRGTPPVVGHVNYENGVVCHVELFRRRCAGGRSPSAAFSSNDGTLRLLDCATNKFTSHFTYPHRINRTAADPNAQLRLVVGDSSTAYVTAADTGEIVQELRHHTADVFVAAWSGDGIHFATGAEDRRVLVYDARNWSAPVADVACQAACPRSMKFSPLGEGPPILLIGEAEDAVVALDGSPAGMYRRKQTMPFFGTVGGVDWRPDGRAFWIANCDTHFGGLMEFERVGLRFGESDEEHGEAEVVGRDPGAGRRAAAHNDNRWSFRKAGNGSGNSSSSSARSSSDAINNTRKRASWQMSGWEGSGDADEVGRSNDSGGRERLDQNNSASKRRSLSSSATATRSSSSAGASAAAPVAAAPATAVDGPSEGRRRSEYIERARRTRAPPRGGKESTGAPTTRRGLRLGRMVL